MVMFPKFYPDPEKLAMSYLNKSGKKMAIYKPKKYEYCPFCSSRLIQLSIDGKDYQACPEVKSCGWVHWGHTPIVSAVIVLDPENNEKVLLVKRKHNPFKGLWSLPAGFAEYGELPKDAAIRELKEEVNLSAGKLMMVDQYLESSNPKTFSILNIFAADHVSGKISVADDVEDTAYFHWKALPEMAFKSQVLALKDFFSRTVLTN